MNHPIVAHDSQRILAYMFLYTVFSHVKVVISGKYKNLNKITEIKHISL